MVSQMKPASFCGSSVEGIEGEPSVPIFAMNNLEDLHRRTAFMSPDTVATEFLLETSAFSLIGSQLDR